MPFLRYPAIALIFPALVGGLGACASTAFGEDGAYVNDALGYRVSPVMQGGRRGELLGADWALVNFTRDSSGQPNDLKGGHDWEVQLALDTNDDGDVDVEGEFPRYDLYFEHRRDDAQVWIQSVPMSDTSAGKSLETLAERYAGSVSGGVYFWSPSTRAVKDERFASRIIAHEEMQVDGHPAYRADIEVANVDEMRLDPSARSRRIRVMLLRPTRGVSHYSGNKRWVASAVIVLALSCKPRDFDTHAAALDQLAHNLTFPDGVAP